MLADFKCSCWVMNDISIFWILSHVNFALLVMRCSIQSFKILPQVAPLLCKIGSFKFLPPPQSQTCAQIPHPSVDLIFLFPELGPVTFLQTRGKGDEVLNWKAH